MSRGEQEGCYLPKLLRSAWIYLYNIDRNLQKTILPCPIPCPRYMYKTRLASINNLGSYLSPRASTKKPKPCISRSRLYYVGYRIQMVVTLNSIYVHLCTLVDRSFEVYSAPYPNLNIPYPRIYNRRVKINETLHLGGRWCNSHKAAFSAFSPGHYIPHLLQLYRSLVRSKYFQGIDIQ